MSADLGSRFWSKVDKSGECWTWTAYKNDMGYGQFYYEGKMRYSHRLTLEETCGPIPEGVEVDHRCHNQACVNPKHLRLATRKQNTENRAGPQINSKSGVLGVSWNKRLGKWLAQVQHNGTRIHVGYFVNLSDAESAVTAKRNELFTHNDVDRVLT